MSLDFDQLTKLEEAVLSQHRRDITDDEKEVQFMKIFKYFKSQMRFAFEYEKGRNDYSMETHRNIEDKEECNRIVKQIINEQCKYPLNRNDQVVTDFAKVERNHGQTANLYKFSIRKGKNIANIGEKDLFLGQLMVSGVPFFNETRAENRKVFISSDVPYCDREKANEMKRTARLIRNESSGNTTYYTRLNVDHNKRDVELLVKKKVGKKATKWLNVHEHDDISEDLVKRYEENEKIKKRTYVPKASRAKDNTRSDTGKVSSKRGGSDTPSPVRKAKGKKKQARDKPPSPRSTRGRRRANEVSSDEENKGEPSKTKKGGARAVSESEESEKE